MGELKKGEASNGLSGLQKNIGMVVNWFEVVALCLGIATLAILLISNVIARSFFDSIYFVEEISEFLVIFTTFIGLSYAARKARHIRMGAIFDALGPRPKKILIFIISATSALVMFIMAGYALEHLIIRKNAFQTTPALNLPYWYFLIFVPIGFLSAGIQYIRTILKNIVEKEVWLSPDQKGEYEEEEY